MSEKIEHSRICEVCGAETYQFERCHVCLDVPWRSNSDPHPHAGGGES